MTREDLMAAISKEGFAFAANIEEEHGCPMPIRQRLAFTIAFIKTMDEVLAEHGFRSPFNDHMKAHLLKPIWVQYKQQSQPGP